MAPVTKTMIKAILTLRHHHAMRTESVQVLRQSLWPRTVDELVYSDFS